MGASCQSPECLQPLLLPAAIMSGYLVACLDWLVVSTPGGIGMPVGVVEPRVFGRPKSTDNWASRAVLGERVLLAQPEDSIAPQHKSAIKALKWVIAFGFLCAVYGLIFLQIEMAVFGTIITILAKTWFLDRMVWLYQDLAETNPEYKRWLY